MKEFLIACLNQHKYSASIHNDIKKSNRSLHPVIQGNLNGIEVLCSPNAPVALRPPVWLNWLNNPSTLKDASDLPMPYVPDLTNLDMRVLLVSAMAEILEHIGQTYWKENETPFSIQKMGWNETAIREDLIKKYEHAAEKNDAPYSITHRPNTQNQGVTADSLSVAKVGR